MDLKFISKTIDLKLGTTDSVFTSEYSAAQRVQIPIAHHDGNYTADAEVMARLEGDDRIAFTYVDNPNGSDVSVAGILS